MRICRGSGIAADFRPVFASALNYKVKPDMTNEGYQISLFEMKPG